MKFKKIGVIGGMGPEATSLFYKYIIRICQRKFKSKYDDSFPEILIHNLPIPNITKGKFSKKLVCKKIKESIRILEKGNVDFIVYPCNTLDYFLDYLRNTSNVPVLSIVEETLDYLTSQNIFECILFASETTMHNNLYSKNPRIAIQIPKSQSRVTKIIENALAGIPQHRDFKKLIDSEEKKHVVLGCTDLSIPAEGYNSKYIVDSLQILANATMERAAV